MDNKFIVFLRRYSAWFMLFLAILLFFCCVAVFNISLGYFFEVDSSMLLFFGVNFVILFWALFRKASHLLDDAFYKMKFDRTGDDYEHRYCDMICSCGYDFMLFESMRLPDKSSLKLKDNEN